MKRKFIQTSNVQNFYNSLTGLQERGASEACLIVIDGVPGLGKTHTLTHWVAKSGSIYLRAKREWTPNWALSELLKSLNREPPHGFEKKYNLATREISERMGQLNSDLFGIVIDEADHISRNPKIMETFRDLSDILEVPIVFVGMGKVRDNLTKFPQIASRVSQYVKFKPASQNDVRLFFDGLSEVKVADDVIKFVHHISKGFNREIMEAIPRIERLGRIVGGDVISLADLAGEVIMNRRETGEPIIVPENLAHISSAA